MTMRTLARLTAPLLLPLALSGCISLGGGKTPETLFTLTPDSAPGAGTTASGTAADALVVLDPETDRTLAVQRVAVTVDGSNLAYLEKALWAERPARLFRSLLAETLRARGNRLVFEDSEAVASGRNRIGGRLLDMGYDAPSRAARVRFDAVREGTGGTISTRRFEASVPVAAPEPAVVGPALNRAANDVARQVADWVG